MDSTVLIGCPTCGRRYRYDAGRFGYTGVRIRCRTCESVMRVDVPEALRGQPAGAEEPAAWRADAAVAAARGEALPPATDPAAEPGNPAPSVSLPEANQGEAAPAEGRTAPRDAASARETGHVPHALLADRDPELRAVLRSLLEQRGHRVTEVADGPAVQNHLESDKPDLIVLNVFLPEVLGVTLCSDIKNDTRLRDTPVFLVGSLYRRDRFMRHPDDLYGADGFIDGSASPEQIAETLDQLLQASREGQAGAPQGGAGGQEEELARLARIVVSDIILYNPDTAPQELASGNFLAAFAAELREGEQLAAERFGHLPGHLELYAEHIRQAVAQHNAAADVAPGLRA